MKNIQKHENNFNLIRLIAALQVITVHALNHFEIHESWTDAFKSLPGVPIFFFISGYLVGTSYLRGRHNGLLSFFTNRFLRIFPGLWACILVSVLAVGMTGYFQTQNIGILKFVTWVLGQATIVQFFNPDFMRAFGVGVLNGALWTISIELQFYFLVPLLFHLLDRRRILLAVVFICSLLFNLFIRFHAEDRSLTIKLLSVSFVPWLYMFLFGFLVAYFDSLAAFIKRSNFIVLLFSYLISMNFIGDYKMNAQNSINPISFLFLACLLFKVAYAQLPLTEKLKRAINKSDLSYGLYLYHMPVINLLLFASIFSSGINLALTMGISIVAAGLSWHFLENPALKLKKY